MEITVKELPYADVIVLRGRLERSTAPGLAEVLKAHHERGRHNIIIDMSQVEYMSSAGFRMLLNAQRDRRGEVILAQVPEHIQQALELTGITAFFKTFDDLSAAVAYAATLPGDASPPEKKTLKPK
jgi:anti-sigma B factor antagonist